MLENYIREYAKYAGFGPEFVDEIVSPEEENHYALTLADKVCSVSEVMVDNKIYAQAVMMLDATEDSLIERIKKVGSRIWGRGGDIGFFITDKESGALGFFAGICLQNCDISSFMVFMRNLLTISMAAGGITEPIDEVMKEFEAYPALDFEDWLKKAGLDRGDLSKSGGLIYIKDIPILVSIIDNNKLVRLSSPVASSGEHLGFVDSIENNVYFNALKGLRVWGSGLYFDTVISAGDFSPDEFAVLLGEYVADAKNVSHIYQESIKNMGGNGGQTVAVSSENMDAMAIMTGNFLSV